MEFYVSSFCSSSLKDASTIHAEVSEKKVFYVSDYLQATDGEYIIAICHLSDSGIRLGKVS